jgi:O-antigen/teichoic acid export membrane protein
VGLVVKAIEKLNKYKIAKNASILAFGQIISRVMAIFYLAALARYVGKGGIGQIATGNAVNNLLLLLVAPGLSILFVRDVAPYKEKAVSYISNMIFIRLLLIMPFAILSIAIAYSGKYPRETGYIINLYMLLYIIDTLTEILLATFRAYERMEFEAGIQMARDFINIAFSLLAIYLKGSLLAIVSISVLAQVCKFVLAYGLVRWRFVRLHFTVDLQLSKTLLITSLSFGILLVIHTLQSQMAVFVLSLYYDATEVGTYAAANTLVTMLLFIPNSFAAAIFPNLSRLNVESRTNLSYYYRLSYKYLLVLGFPLGLGTMLVGDRAIRLIYGGEFKDSGEVIRIMAIFLFMIVGYSNGSLLHATGRQRFYAWTQGLAALLNGLLCFILVPVQGAVGAAIAFTAAGLVTFFIHSVACHRQLGLALPWETATRVAAATLVMGVVVQIALAAQIPWVIVSAVVAPLVYTAMIFLLGTASRAELKTLGGAPLPVQPQVIAEAAASA